MISFRMMILFIVILIASSTLGCSTLMSQHGHFGQTSLFIDPGVICSHQDVARQDLMPIYYSGVSADLYFVFLAPFRDDGEISSLTRIFYPFFLVYSVVDLPFSLTADTIIFPYNYYALSHCYVIRDGKKYSRW